MTETFYTAKKCPNCNAIFNVSGLKSKTIKCPGGCGAQLQITPVRIEYVIQDV